MGYGLMGEWQRRTLGDLLTLQRGFDLPTQDRSTGGVPVVASTGIVAYHNKAQVKGPGVVIGRSGSIGGGQYIRGDFWPLNTTLWVKDFKGNDPHFCYYLLKQIDFSAFNSGSGVPTLNRNHVHPLPVNYPNAPEQKAIANVLSSLDDKIELNRRMNATLERQAQAIFRDWFVDFGPLRRKMAMTQQGLASDPVAILGGLIPNPAEATSLAALFPDTLGNDGLPLGWEMAPLEETLVLQRGFDLPKTTRTDGDYAVIAASGPSGTHNESKVRGPGVCTGRSGVLGNVYFVADDFWPLNTSLWIKSFPNSTPLYAYHILREIDLGAFNAGSAVPTLNRNHIHGLPVAKPSMPIIREFDKIGMHCYGRMKANETENRTLAETRDYLLPRLMSGKVRVADAERAVA